MPQEVDHKTIPFLRQKRREILSTHTQWETLVPHSKKRKNTDAQLSLSLSSHNTQENTSPVQVFNETNQRNEPMRKKETEIHSPHELFVLEKRLRKHFTRETLVQQETQTRMLSSLSLSARTTTQENTSQVQVFNETNPTKRTHEKKGDRNTLTPRTFCVGKAAAKALYPRNPSSARNANTDAQLLSSRNAKTRMLSFSGSRKHLTGSSFPTKRNNEKMLTPNGCESSEDGCETLRSARNAKTRMLSFSQVQ